MPPSEAKEIYLYFLRAVAETGDAWCLTCHFDICAVDGGPEHTVLPLFPDQESAYYFTALHWPDLLPGRVELADLLGEYLPVAELSHLPVGIGLAPHPDAVVVPAERLRLDLLRLCLFANGVRGTPPV